MASTRQAPNGFNCNNQIITNGGAGTFNWGTAIGANSTGLITENMSAGGVVNLQETNSSAATFPPSKAASL